MKANELMLGDWVYVKDYPMRPTPTKIKPEHFIRSLVEFEPIPLTSEILEKNGFVHYEEDEESFHNEDCVFIKQNLGGYGVCLDKNRTVSGLFHYVHELQHALKLCGIEKTIEL